MVCSNNLSPGFFSVRRAKLVKVSAAGFMFFGRVHHGLTAVTILYFYFSGWLWGFELCYRKC